MEKLTSLVPPDLKQAISESAPEDLDYTCRSLLDFLLPSPQFQQVVRELADPEMGLCKKSREAALDLKKEGNDCFMGGDFEKALSYYSQALRATPMSSNDVDKNLLATLYVNRASSMHKLGLLEECKRDCGRALAVSPCYVKAWYRRGKANVSLENYEDAVHDLEVALSMESSSTGRNHIKEDLEIALNYFKRTCGTINLSSRNMNENLGSLSFEPSSSTTEPHQIELQCISTQAKGRGMVSRDSIPPSSLIHSEEPLAALVIVISQIKVNSIAIVRMKSQQQPGNAFAIEKKLTSNIEQLRVGQAVYPIGRLFNHSCQPNIHTYFLSRKLLLRSTEFVPAGFPLELSYGPQVGQWAFQERQKLLEDQYFFKCKCSGCLELNFSDLVIHAFRCVKPTCLGVVLENHLVNNGETKENSADTLPAIHNLELPLPLSLQKKDAIDEVAHLLLERSAAMLQISPGYCLNCCSKCDLKASVKVANTALTHIERLKNAMISKKSLAVTLPDALKSLKQLRSVTHAYSKDFAEAEDIVAEACCLVGEFESSLEHCKASIKILENLYHNNHIVIANELVKLASLQLSLGDHVAALYSIDRLEAIFSLYYGPHAAQIIPYLKSLRREADQHIP